MLVWFTSGGWRECVNCEACTLFVSALKCLKRENDLPMSVRVCVDIPSAINRQPFQSCPLAFLALVHFRLAKRPQSQTSNWICHYWQRKNTLPAYPEYNSECYKPLCWNKALRTHSVIFMFFISFESTSNSKYLTHYVVKYLFLNCAPVHEGYCRS